MKHLLVFILGVCLVISAAHTQTWVSLNGPQIASDVRDIAVTSNGNTVYAADANYVLKSTNSGTVWAVTPQPYGNPLLVLVKPNDGNTVLAASEGEMIYSSNGGGSWSSISGLTNLTPLRLVALRTNNNIMLLGRMWGTSNKSMWESRNGGASWNASEYWNFQTHVYDFSPYPVAGQGWNSYVAACGSYGTPSGSNRYAVADQRGVWVSPDSGVHWLATRLGEHNIVSVAIAPKANPAYFHMYAVNQTSANDTVFRSTDGGTEWLPVFNNAAEFRLLRINHSTSPVAFFLTTSDGVYRSTNEGNNWSKLTGFPENDVKSLAVGAGSTVFAGTATTLYKSTDNGSTWTEVGKMNVTAADGAGATLWAVSKDNSFVGKSTNGGTSWSNGHIGSAGTAFSAEAMHRVGSTGHLFVGGALNTKAAIYRSTDSGNGFSQVYHNSSTFSNGSRIYTIGSDLVEYDSYIYAGGGVAISKSWENVFHSTNDGAAWNVSGYSPLWSGNQIVFGLAAISYDVRYAILGNGLVLKTTNAWANKDSVYSVSGTGNSLAVHPVETSTVYAASSGGLWRSTNAGSAWSQVRTDNVKRVQFHPSFPASSDNLFALAGDNIYHSTNGGSNWSTVTGNLPPPVSTLVAPTDAGFLYAGTGKGVFALDIQSAKPQGLALNTTGYSNHPKLTWTANTEVDVNPSGHYLIDCRALIGGQWTNWSTVATVSGSTIEWIDYAVCNAGSGSQELEYRLRARDAGMNLSEYSDVVEIQWTGQTCVEKAATEPAEALPLQFVLLQNHPNPFNPQTEIRYALPEDAHVSLRVYDLLGREVATLVDELRPAGYHAALLDGTDLASGVAYASGVYFARFTATDAMGALRLAKITKLVLMK